MAQMLKEKAEFTDVEGNIISQNETISNWVQNNLILNMEDRKFTIEFQNESESGNLEQELTTYGQQIHLSPYQNQLLANFSSKLVQNVGQTEKINVEDIK